MPPAQRPPLMFAFTPKKPAAAGSPTANVAGATPPVAASVNCGAAHVSVTATAQNEFVPATRVLSSSRLAPNALLLLPNVTRHDASDTSPSAVVRLAPV